MTADARAALRSAKARLDAVDWWPRPVSLHGVRIVTVGWLFRLPWFRRFTGYTMWNLILLARPLADVSDGLVTHELCHVWQMQHRPVRMPLSYLVRGYAQNPYEVQARAAAMLPGPAGSERAPATSQDR